MIASLTSHVDDDDKNLVLATDAMVGYHGRQLETELKLRQKRCIGVLEKIKETRDADTDTIVVLILILMLHQCQ